MLGHHSGASKTKTGQGGLVRVALFWKSRRATCVPAGVIFIPRDQIVQRAYTPSANKNVISDE